MKDLTDFSFDSQGFGVRVNVMRKMLLVEVGKCVPEFRRHICLPNMTPPSASFSHYA